MDDSQLVAAMVEEPTLIRRPIVASEGASAIGSRKADLEAFAELVRREG